MGPMGRWLEIAPKGAQTAFILADAGVEVTAPEAKEWGTFVKFSDPDGLPIVVSEPK